MAKAATATAPSNGADAAANGAQKTQKSYALYITLDGEGKEVENNSPVSGAKVVRMKFANGGTLEANKEEVSDERFQAIIIKLKNTDFVEKALKNKQVLSAVEDIKFENAKARRDEARKAAKDAQESLDLGI
jgi:hypothetical protein